MAIRKRNIVYIILGAAFLLLIPFIAMRFDSGVNWDLMDFLVAFVLLAGAGLAYELVVRKIDNKVLRYGTAALFVVLFLLIWVELAVGIF